MGAWLIPPGKMELGLDEVHIWRRRRVVSGTVGHRAQGGTLSKLINLYTGIKEKDIVLQKGEHGKPYLPDSDLRFNLSHSVDLALYAFARGRDVGVDLERETRKVKALDIAERFFSPSEKEFLRSLPEDGLQAAFLRIWTRKEAYVKAVGTGITEGLNTFSVAPDKFPAFCLPVPESPKWALWDISVGDGYAGAMSTRTGQIRVRLFHLAN